MVWFGLPQADREQHGRYGRCDSQQSPDGRRQRKRLHAHPNETHQGDEGDSKSDCFKNRATHKLFSLKITAETSPRKLSFGIND